ncbi:helix-turn-helix domain-containing protein [Intestinibacter sp.]|uniref:helix-turn-helix domain-containing protein n=1 Tax=Intestinibacter sp. TaxID=1965304 RepID=UPI002A74DCA4|nr:helix-turn-helix transcriptional regulator [Intestinibacter sp.]MDY2736178.1 helix-turn-helix transcriptional regulator [Intestinibacter sp.]
MDKKTTNKTSLKSEVKAINRNTCLSEENFSKRLRQARIDKGLMIKEVAQMCGIDKNALSGLELGKYTLTRSNLEALQKIFDMSLICTEEYEYFILHYDEFIERLKDLVVEYGYEKLGKILGVHYRTIESWIKGRVIKIKTYDRIKEKLEDYKLIP